MSGGSMSGSSTGPTVINGVPQGDEDPQQEFWPLWFGDVGEADIPDPANDSRMNFYPYGGTLTTVGATSGTLSGNRANPGKESKSHDYGWPLYKGSYLRNHKGHILTAGEQNYIATAYTRYRRIDEKNATQQKAIGDADRDARAAEAAAEAEEIKARAAEDAAARTPTAANASKAMNARTKATAARGKATAVRSATTARTKANAARQVFQDPKASPTDRARAAVEVTAYSAQADTMTNVVVAIDAVDLESAGAGAAIGALLGGLVVGGLPAVGTGAFIGGVGTALYKWWSK